MKPFKLLILFLAPILLNAQTKKSLELTTFRDYTFEPPRTSQKLDLRNSQDLFEQLKQLANQIQHNGKAPENAINTLKPFLKYNCNWPILPGIILAITPEDPITREILWHLGQLALSHAGELKKNQLNQQLTQQ